MNFDPVTQDCPNRDKDNPASIKPITFDSFGHKLIGTIFIAAGKGPHPTVVFLHGFPGNEKNYDIAQAVRRFGWNAMIFHYRGSWGSEGDFTFSGCIDDVKIAVEFLRNNYSKEFLRVDGNRLVLIGHSMGGFVALLTAVWDEQLKFAASLAGFNFGYFTQFIEEKDEVKNITLENLDEGVNLLKGTDSRELLQEMFDNKVEWDLINYINFLTSKNILLVAAKNDHTAPAEIHHYPLVNALRETSSATLHEYIIESTHSFSDRRIELIRTVIDWLQTIEF